MIRKTGNTILFILLVVLLMTSTIVVAFGKESGVHKKTENVKETSINSFYEEMRELRSDRFMAQVEMLKKLQEEKLKIKIKKEKEEARKKEERIKKEREKRGFVYRENIPMPYEHQAYLFDKTYERNIDYKKAVAIIALESSFDPNAVNQNWNDTKDYGYFQINSVNHKRMKELLGGEDPLDPKTSINWGTFILSELYRHWEGRGIRGAELDEYVWSSYNKGITGFKNNGKATNYIHIARSRYNQYFAK